MLLEEQEEKPGFIQSCSLEDGCSMRFYGDECQNSFGHRFSTKSMKQRFYDGYGGDCSYKAPKNQSSVCSNTVLEEAIGEISILFFLAAMRIVLQRVLSASVTVDGKMISKIGKGIMCLVGIRDDDDQACSEVLAKKMLVEQRFDCTMQDVRLWDDEKGKPWSKSVKDMGYEVLLVSQFTLFGSVKRKCLLSFSHLQKNRDQTTTDPVCTHSFCSDTQWEPMRRVRSSTALWST